MAKRSMAKLSDKSPYSTTSKHEEQSDTSNNFYAQQN